MTACTAGTLLNIYVTVRRNIPEDIYGGYESEGFMKIRLFRLSSYYQLAKKGLEVSGQGYHRIPFQIFVFRMVLSSFIEVVPCLLFSNVYYWIVSRLMLRLRW